MATARRPAPPPAIDPTAIDDAIHRYYGIAPDGYRSPHPHTHVTTTPSPEGASR